MSCRVISICSRFCYCCFLGVVSLKPVGFVCFFGALGLSLLCALDARWCTLIVQFFNTPTLAQYWKNGCQTLFVSRVSNVRWLPIIIRPRFARVMATFSRRKSSKNPSLPSWLQRTRLMQTIGYSLPCAPSTLTHAPRSIPAVSYRSLATSICGAYGEITAMASGLTSSPAGKSLSPSRLLRSHLDSSRVTSLLFFGFIHCNKCQIVDVSSMSCLRSWVSPNS